MDDLVGRVNAARAYHDLWAAIEGHGIRKNHRDELIAHEVLAETIMDASKKAFWVTICSLYDAHPRSVSIQRFNEYLKSSGKPDPSWDARFTEIQELAVRLNKVRNKYFCHVSEETFERDFLAEVKLIYDDFPRIIERTWELVEGLHSRYGLGELEYEQDPLPDLRKLFPNFDQEKAWS